jgi:hypothetical protein
MLLVMPGLYELVYRYSLGYSLPRNQAAPPGCVIVP